MVQSEIAQEGLVLDARTLDEVGGFHAGCDEGRYFSLVKGNSRAVLLFCGISRQLTMTSFIKTRGRKVKLRISRTIQLTLDGPYVGSNENRHRHLTKETWDFGLIETRAGYLHSHHAPPEHHSRSAMEIQQRTENADLHQRNI